MQIIITGGAGFLGQRLATVLLTSSIDFEQLVLVDVVMPTKPGPDERVVCQQTDLTKTGAVQTLITHRTGIVFHLAAIVSSHAEKDFDLGWTVNLDVTRQLLEACRQQKRGIRFVFASSLAVYGGTLPDIVDETTALTPSSSYGAQKAIGELLVNDYTRKGFVDGRVLRLPTVCVRPGKPNLAASSFVSSIIREPINGETTICPVSEDLPIWMASPNTIIQNFIWAATIDGATFGHHRTVNLPGIGPTVRQMLNALERLTDKATVDRVQFIPDEAISTIVYSWPVAVDNTRGIQLGFSVDEDFDGFIRQFMHQNKA